MSGGERPTRHYKFLRTVGYITESGPELETVEFGELTLVEVEAFMLNLPREYRQLAIFVLATAADPEIAINLDVERVKALWARFGKLGAMQQLSNVPVHRDWELLLPIHIRGRRAASLRRKNIPHGEEPTQVYLDRNARPMTLKKVNAGFVRASKRMNLQTPITLETIAHTVILSFMNQVTAMKCHGAIQ